MTSFRLVNACLLVSSYHLEALALLVVLLVVLLQQRKLFRHWSVQPQGAPISSHGQGRAGTSLSISFKLERLGVMSPYPKFDRSAFRPRSQLSPRMRQSCLEQTERLQKNVVADVHVFSMLPGSTQREVSILLGLMSKSFGASASLFPCADSLTSQHSVGPSRSDFTWGHVRLEKESVAIIFSTSTHFRTLRTRTTCLVSLIMRCSALS